MVNLLLKDWGNPQEKHSQIFINNEASSKNICIVLKYCKPVRPLLF